MMDVPAPSAPSAKKMAYYRSQHSTAGVKATHLIGIPTLLLPLPPLAARPRIGLPMFIGSLGLQIAGRRLFEHNKPALTRALAGAPKSIVASRGHCQRTDAYR